ncbi:WHEP-TRS domain protein [Teladorsagia circumcincta]|uniref:WHEP-TRS domain protein n=1 Tax=Teladorsagia circumcincta TaxID=45464 RepID=A0A2G9TWD7_TELCI|nr:WHEP-TRS domain protein [Teladorsagia circumcincta]
MTGHPHKPGQPPASSPSNAQDTSFDASALYNEIQAQGDLVRQEKQKDAKSDASKAAIQKLLELKKLYKEKTGQEYKPK